MKKLFIIISLLFFTCSIGFAYEKYAVQKPDGTVSIITYMPGSHDSLELVVRDLGYTGYPIIKVDDKDLPPREDRKYWMFNDVPIGPKLKVNLAEKQKDIDLKAAEESKKTAVLEKLKITKEELTTIVGKSKS